MCYISQNFSFYFKKITLCQSRHHFYTKQDIQYFFCSYIKSTHNIIKHLDLAEFINIILHDYDLIWPELVCVFLYFVTNTKYNEKFMDTESAYNIL